MSSIVEYLSSCRDGMVTMLRELVAIDSPSDQPGAVNHLATRLTELFTRLGTTVERQPQLERGDHLRITWGQGAGQVLLLGHMDTVWPVGEAQRRPMTICQDSASTLATGPGIFDMKGSLVIAYYAYKALHSLGRAPRQRLVLLLTSDEEAGSPTSRALIEREARHSKAALVLEPTSQDALVTWRKGIAHLEIHIQGRASHSGAAYHQGVSAVKELAHQVLFAESLTDYDQGTTVNVGLVHGGSRVNVRPASACASIDVRFASPSEGERVVKAIRGALPLHPEAKLHVAGGVNRPAWEPSPADNALFERARQVGARMGMDLWAAGSGGGSDGNLTAALGVPTLDGLGIVGGDAHGLDEWVDLDSMVPRAALLAELLLDMES